MTRTLLRRRVLLPATIVAAAALGLALWLFQPWALVLDDRVDEAVPTAVAVVRAPSRAPSGPARSTPEVRAPTAPETVVAGTFISHEHETTGRVRVLELGDGSRVLRLEDLDTSNGPDLRVWVTDAPVLDGRDGWHVFDDGEYVELGALKGNIGSSNYALPAGTDLGELSSVTIWCDRFDVSFGAAELRTA